MAYSTIKQKKCKGNCGRYPTLGMNGYCYKCAPEEIKIKFANKKKVAQRKANERTKVRSLNNLSVNKDLVDSKKGDLSQNEWYAEQRSKLVGKCCNCGGATPKDNDKYYKWAIAHVLPKNIFKSVAKDDNVWIELCLPCHVLFDRNLATASEMRCFKLAVKQFYKFQDKITEHHKYLDLFIEYSNQLNTK